MEIKQDDSTYDPYLLFIAKSLYNAWNYNTGSVVVWRQKWDDLPKSEKDYWIKQAWREQFR